MNRISYLGVPVLALALTGCESWSIIMSSKIEPPTQGSDWAAIMPVNTPQVWSALFKKDKVSTAYSRFCLNPAGQNDFQIMVAPLAGSVLTALGGAAWDLGVDAVNSKVDKIQERSSNTWTATWTTTAKDLGDAKCLALVRYRLPNAGNSSGTPDPQMVMVLKVVNFEISSDDKKSVQFVPILVGSKTSSALTKDEGSGVGTIGLTAAGVISYYVNGELKDSTPDTISVSGIKVGDSNKNPTQMLKAVGDSAGEDLNGALATKPVSFPYPKTGDPKKVSLFIRFSVAETGTLSGKDAKAKAQIKVITDALGTVAKTALKERFEADGSK